ncbi:MAG: 4-(cytidine 5'-diphospho)-2-C-methyl-D-erythritol kinase [Eubacteriaceae bacterium]|nr:4-(cytidine 5'-diphospho)-2-C-methyl-D-erythritol kinase [Eubacteriaceae bacterium]
MNKLTAYARAKINLGLDILCKRDDGYHDIRTLMHTVSLCDTLVFEISDETSLSCDMPGIPIDGNNIVIKCLNRTEEAVGKKLPMKIELYKRIPSGAGLGGGSADGAETIKAANELYGLGLTPDEQAEIAARAGSDIPFLVYGGFALCEGRGELITKLPKLGAYPCLLVKPEESVDTGAAYAFFDGDTGQRKNCDFQEILRSLREGTDTRLHNDFEDYLRLLYPKTSSIKDELISSGAFACSLSGSGSCFYGLFRETSEAQKAYSEMKAKYTFAELTVLC